MTGEPEQIWDDEGRARVIIDTEYHAEDRVPVTSRYAPFLAVLYVNDVADSTPYVLVDLDDVTNYRHTLTNSIVLQSLSLHAEKDTQGEFDIWVGVITEVDETNGTAKWIHCFHLEAIGNVTDGTDRFAQKLIFQNIDLAVNSDTPGSEYLENIVTNIEQAGHTNWQTDVGLASPVGGAGGATGKPGVGDLVIWVEEIGGSGIIDFTLSAEYNTV
jgi:hypothetical protein